MKFVHLLAAAGFAAGALVALGAGTASADPAGCTTSVQLMDVSASCSGGDGEFDVRANCFGLYSDTYHGGIPAFGNYTSVPSATTGIGGRVTASCSYFPIPLGIATGAQVTCWRLVYAGPPPGFQPGVCG